ncbi:hypothetical protein [Neotamlana laminarinivorans]|uniref:Nucleotide-diphospho-sugar transferase domain-containing protein n=1 Tax=Neotamlana laminarinivorans TaxID=2883124 RepID=A0A9X1HZG5_9FLAO|nr:hypothetical protein [Tamlana laminarinivorans]MCB4798998.1 hypothetical protein [Tamlana laminarinivorans]
MSNSLYHSGFRGAMYVGYRGDLPDWVNAGERVSIQGYDNVMKVKNIKEEMTLYFIPLSTSYSLTNYKPNFMLDLLNGPAKELDYMFYFDPDIVVKQPWACFEEWANCGIAVSEDVNSPLEELHPRRVGWRTYFKEYNMSLKCKSNIYVNGGFIGVNKSNLEFLKLWKNIQDYMANAIGGLENSIFSNQTYKTTIPVKKGFQIFDKSDQDALNAAIECYKDHVSYIGLEGMGFKEGYNLMIHALGSPKPWKTNLLSRAIQGHQPRLTDVSYWRVNNTPFSAHSNLEIKRKKLSILVAKIIGRFYSK